MSHGANGRKAYASLLGPASLITDAALLIASSAAYANASPRKALENEIADPISINVREEAGAVKGRVFDERDEAVPGATVILYGDSAYGYAFTKEDGSFEITALAPGTYVVHARCDGHGECILGSVEVKTKETTALELRLVKD